MKKLKYASSQVAIQLHPQPCQPQNKHTTSSWMHLRNCLVARYSGEIPRTMDLMPIKPEVWDFPQKFCTQRAHQLSLFMLNPSFMHWKFPQVCLRTFFYPSDGAQMGTTTCLTPFCGEKLHFLGVFLFCCPKAYSHISNSNIQLAICRASLPYLGVFVSSRDPHHLE